MTERKTYHVVNDEGEWKVRLEKAQRASGVFESKSEAIERARELAKHAPLGQVVVHGRDNAIENEWTYGEDPRRYPG